MTQQEFRKLFGAVGRALIECPHCDGEGGRIVTKDTYVQTGSGRGDCYQPEEGRACGECGGSGDHYFVEYVEGRYSFSDAVAMAVGMGLVSEQRAEQMLGEVAA